MSQAVLDDLCRLLDLEPIEVNVFRGSSPKEQRQRVFGGQVAGQALVAAGRTVKDRQVHSLHAYFLRPGDPSIPILYLVDRIRDGSSFTTRRVVAIQHGKAIFNLAASFHVPEDGFDHQMEMPEVPPPETLATFKERTARFRHELGDWYDVPRPIDTRVVGNTSLGERRQPGLQPRQRVWLRADGVLGDDPLLHACVVAYASDLTLLDTTTLPHPVSGWEDKGVRWRAWTMPCGSTGPSEPTNGCSTTKKARRPQEPEASLAASSSRGKGSWRYRWPKRA